MKNIFRRIIKNKKLLVLILVIVVILVIAGLYGTFATSSTVAGSSDTYTINLTGSSNTVSVPANSSKTVIYQLTNTNKGVVKYGVGYSGTNITVKVYSDSQDPETGLFDYGDTKFIKLYITNSGSVSSNATIRSILGYENGGNLIVPSGVTLVTQKYNAKSSAAYIISNKFTKTGTVTSNSIAHDIDTTHSMIKDVDGNIRYYGQNPNNYIDIGDRDSSNNPILWRIIGVFDGKLKLIRSSSIGSYAWDSNNVNDWSTASLKTYLNSGGYYTSGITDDAKNRIAEVTWYLGGFSSSSAYPNQIYAYERGTTVYSGRSTTSTGKIALAYPSDYGYATDLSQCNQNLNNYGNNANNYVCRGNNWMWYTMTGATTATSTSGANNLWLLTTRSSSANSAWSLYASGSVNYYNGGVNSAVAVVPVLYLDSKQVIESGSGSSIDPYVLSV